MERWSERLIDGMRALAVAVLQRISIPLYRFLFVPIIVPLNSQSQAAAAPLGSVTRHRTAVRPLKYDPRSLMRREITFNTENNYSMAFFGKGKPALAHVPLEEE